MSVLTAEKEVDKWESDSSTEEKTNDKPTQENHVMKEEPKPKSKSVTIVESKKVKIGDITQIKETVKPTVPKKKETLPVSNFSLFSKKPLSDN